MSRAAIIRLLYGERCNVVEIAESLGVSRSYVRFVLRKWGLMPPTERTFPDTPAKLRYAREQA